jgi:hypothetical protein
MLPQVSSAGVEFDLMSDLASEFAKALRGEDALVLSRKPPPATALRLGLELKDYGEKGEMALRWGPLCLICDTTNITL